MKSIKITETLVTPEQAKKWLDKTKLNRKISDRNVNFLASKRTTQGRPPNTSVAQKTCAVYAESRRAYLAQSP